MEELVQGILGIIVFVVLGFVLVRAFRGKRVIHLALTKFVIDPENENQVVLEGRESGLWSWLLFKLNLSSKYIIHVRKEYISYASDSWLGHGLMLTPVHKISTTSCGYSQSVGLLIFAIACVVTGLILTAVGGVAVFFVMLILAAIFFVLFYYSKSFEISIHTIGGAAIGLSFKRSYIENVPVDFEKVKEVILLINELVEESNRR
ncbi:MAG: hypothetical protein LBJ39_01805 [Tannerellaceae bacterium]|jgi:hypothetical protein|nr:hypothetical protein [Tannerellaceae bacterium]